MREPSDRHCFSPATAPQHTLRGFVPSPSPILSYILRLFPSVSLSPPHGERERQRDRGRERMEREERRQTYESSFHNFPMTTRTKTVGIDQSSLNRRSSMHFISSYFHVTTFSFFLLLLLLDFDSCAMPTTTMAMIRSAFVWLSHKLVIASLASAPSEILFLLAFVVPALHQ